MDLIHNQVLKFIEDDSIAFYRVLMASIIDNTVLIAKMPIDENLRNFKIKIVKRMLDELKEEFRAKKFTIVEIEEDFSKLNPSNSSSEIAYQNRLKVMEGFFDIKNLHDRLKLDNGLGGLVDEALKKKIYSKPHIYNLVKMLFKYGFTEHSLKLEYFNCGAPGEKRPWVKGGKIVGAKPLRYINKTDPQHIQLGMTEEWREKIINIDRALKLPKPRMPARIRKILEIGWAEEYEFKNNTLKAKALKLGQYPTDNQIKWVLKTHYDKVETLKNKTTERNFNLNKRGLTGRSIEGVAGPGHTYAIDSTVGEVYLVSSLNRNWFVGRPIVYIVVDVWSTAIIGFYVCLEGPSWRTACYAIYCSVANPKIVSRFRDYECKGLLQPHPTLPNVIWMDRGEGLSKAARITGAKLEVNYSYMPPYRADWKSPVEIPHRIVKDAQYHFLPGAIDSRRKEYELRKFNPKLGRLTIAEYTRYIASIIDEYNATADRSHRLDAYMKATDVHPTPAGLWRWGHENGIGFRTETPADTLITSLMEKGVGKWTLKGFYANNTRYISPDENEQKVNTTLARNRGSWDVEFHYYPGRLEKIWVYGKQGERLKEFTLCDKSYATPDLNLYELQDALAYEAQNKAEIEHTNKVIAINEADYRDNIAKEAKKAYSSQKDHRIEKISVQEAKTRENDHAHNRLISEEINLDADLQKQPNEYDSDIHELLKTLVEGKSEARKI